MSIETIPRTERYEFDPVVRDLQVRVRDRDHRAVALFAGRVALRDTRDRSGLDPRDRDQLSPEDIEQLEAYFDFLRAQYGIPKNQSVFPKHESEPRSTAREAPNAESTEVSDGG